MISSSACLDTCQVESSVLSCNEADGYITFTDRAYPHDMVIWGKQTLIRDTS